MSEDVKCPYCNAEQEINHDDGYGYEQDTLHQQECHECEKIFTYTTTIIFDYEAYKADCLNGGEHKWVSMHTCPVEATQMECEMCGERRKPTSEEMGLILKKREALQKSLKR